MAQQQQQTVTFVPTIDGIIDCIASLLISLKEMREQEQPSHLTTIPQLQPLRLPPILPTPHVEGVITNIHKKMREEDRLRLLETFITEYIDISPRDQVSFGDLKTKFNEVTSSDENPCIIF